MFFFNDTATTEIYTRSLVGSVQMCIRDRRQSRVLQWHDENGVHHLCGSQRDESDLYRRADIPVSYTHLRAHETVLELVCRLLL